MMMFSMVMFQIRVDVHEVTEALMAAFSLTIRQEEMMHKRLLIKETITFNPGNFPVLRIARRSFWEGQLPSTP